MYVVEVRLYTAAEFAKLDLDYAELDRGVVVRMNPPKPLHGVCCGEVFGLLRDHCKPRRLGQVFSNDTGYLLEQAPDTVRGPDVSFICMDRLKGLDLEEYPEFAPDLAVEVLSGGDTPARIQNKIGLYLEKGCRLVWVVDPLRQRVTVYHADGLVLSLTAQDSLSGAPVLPDFECPVAAFFDGC